MGCDDPDVLKRVVRAITEEMVYECLREMGWRPSEDDPNIWLAPASEVEEE